MSLQGSIHTWSDGIGYGAFMPTDRAYFNVRTPRASVRRPSSENVRDYRRNNVTAGIDTHRSDVSFGRTTESIRGGVDGDSRAREATKSLTSGEVGGFCWPAERARGGDVETILASSAVAAASNGSAMASSRLVSARGESKRSSMPPMMLSARSVKQREQDAENNVLSARRRRTPSNGSSGDSTQRSDSTCAPSSSSSIGSYNSSRAPASFRPSPSSPGDQQENSGRRSISSSRSRARRPISYDAAHRVGVAPGMPQLQLSHRSRGAHSSRSNGNSSARERRLRPPSLTAQDAMLPAPSSAAKTPRFRSLDPVFDRHHKYDLVVEERAAEGMVVTGRFGPVQGPSVLAASLLTSELSTPWSHVLRGQKW